MLPLHSGVLLSDLVGPPLHDAVTERLGIERQSFCMVQPESWLCCPQGIGKGLRFPFERQRLAIDACTVKREQHVLRCHLQGAIHRLSQTSHIHAAGWHGDKVEAQSVSAKPVSELT